MQVTAHACSPVHALFQPHPLPHCACGAQIGWGIFFIRALIRFKPATRHAPLHISWLLDFEGSGGVEEIQLRLQQQPSQEGRQQATEEAEVQQGRQWAASERTATPAGEEAAGVLAGEHARGHSHHGPAPASASAGMALQQAARSASGLAGPQLMALQGSMR